MLNRIEINRYGPPGFHLAQKEKDYVQHWILAFLSRSGFGGIFKGDTALQKAYALPRYSEDSDFILNDAKEPDPEAVSAFISAAGFAPVSWDREETGASSSARLRYRGPLYNGSAISEGTVLLEFNKRERTLLKAEVVLITPPYPDIIPYPLLIMDRAEIAAEKVRALSTRSSARDLFDLYFLLHAGVKLEKKIIEEKLNYYKKSFNLKQLEQRITKLKTNWNKEISALTPAQIDFKPVSDFVFLEIGKQLK